MKIERVDENKIRVWIEDSEAKRWNISFQSLCENTPIMRRIFKSAIAFAEENIDFSVSGSKLFVEAIPMEEIPTEEPYDFGMQITRVAGEKELRSAVEQCGYRGRLKKTKMEIERRGTVRRMIYRFSEFENLCSAAGEMSKFYRGESKLYKYNEAFYLFLEMAADAPWEEAEAILAEFGRPVQNGQYMHGRLHEYGHLMIPQNAVEVMEEYFCIR